MFTGQSIPTNSTPSGVVCVVGMRDAPLLALLAVVRRAGLSCLRSAPAARWADSAWSRSDPNLPWTDTAWSVKWGLSIQVLMLEGQGICKKNFNWLLPKVANMKIYILCKCCEKNWNKSNCQKFWVTRLLFQLKLLVILIWLSKKLNLNCL
jgi:hypothetical protein